MAAPNWRVAAGTGAALLILLGCAWPAPTPLAIPRQSAGGGIRLAAPHAQVAHAMPTASLLQAGVDGGGAIRLAAGDGQEPPSRPTAVLLGVVEGTHNAAPATHSDANLVSSPGASDGTSNSTAAAKPDGTKLYGTKPDGSRPDGTSPSSTRPAIAPPTADHRLDRPPSISAEKLDRVLAGYGSPAAGLGPVLYDQGVDAGIDPTYALAFFVVESSAGTRGVARQTRSVGNIRCTPGYACIDGYRAYDTWEEGSADWYTLIRNLYMDDWGLYTPASILPRYAPVGDNNDPAAYAATVVGLVDEWAGR